MRLLLKTYTVVLPCFVVLGSLVTVLSAATYSHFTRPGEWPNSLAFELLTALAGFVSYLPLSIFFAGAVMAIASPLYVLYVVVARARPLGWGMAMLGGVLAGVVATAVTRAPELRLAPDLWWRGPGLMGGMIAGGLAAVLSAWILRRWTAPAVRGGTVAEGLPKPVPGYSFAAMSIALAIALLTTAIALAHSISRTEDVLLQRDANLDAQRFRVATLDQQATLIAGLMSRPGHTARINAEKLQPDGAPNIRPIRDREQLIAELAAIRARLGPVLSTTTTGWRKRSISGDGPMSYSVSFRDRYAEAETQEVLTYQLHGRDVVLTGYNLLTNGGGEVTRFVGLLVAR
jgi:hypothetical protein